MESDDERPEIEVVVEPLEGILEELGATEQEFSVALAKALDEYEQYLDGLEDADEISSIDNVQIELGGRQLRLGDVADLHLSGDVEFLFDDEAEPDAG